MRKMRSPSRWQALPTEAINPSSLKLDTLPIDGIVELMLLDHQAVLEAVRGEKKQIERGVEMLVAALKAGGRLIFVGAGTSGDANRNGVVCDQRVGSQGRQRLLTTDDVLMPRTAARR